MRGDFRRGKCKWFNSKKGFGFIITEDNEELFVHQTEIKAEGFRNLAENEEVEFEIEEGAEGKRKAVKVTGPDGSCVKGDAKRSPFASRARPIPGTRNYFSTGFNGGNDTSLGRGNVRMSQASGMYNWGVGTGGSYDHFSGARNGTKNYDRLYDDHAGYEVSQYNDQSHAVYDNVNDFGERNAIDTAQSRAFNRFSVARRD